MNESDYKELIDSIISGKIKPLCNDKRCLEYDKTKKYDCRIYKPRELKNCSEYLKSMHYTHRAEDFWYDFWALYNNLKSIYQNDTSSKYYFGEIEKLKRKVENPEFPYGGLECPIDGAKDNE